MSNRIEWVAPTLLEVREQLAKVTVSEAVALFGVSRQAVFRWGSSGKSHRQISKGNWVLLCLYVDGVVDIDGKFKKEKENDKA